MPYVALDVLPLSELLRRALLELVNAVVLGPDARARLVDLFLILQKQVPKLGQNLLHLLLQLGLRKPFAGRRLELL